MTQRLADIADFLAAHMPLERLAPADLAIEGLSSLELAGPADLSFLSNPKYLAQLAPSAAACVIVGSGARQAALARGACLVVDEPYYAFALLTQWWKKKHWVSVAAQIHPSAWIDPSARLGAEVSIGACTVIGAGAVIGDGVTIGAHAAIGVDVHIGAHSRLAARVTLEEGCRIGQRCMIHSGAVIGSDGFGFAPHAGQWVKIEQLGAVTIGNDVEIGANTCIDRGALQDTVIEDGVKLDNLVQIAHNVRIGAHSALAACVGVAGSAVLGRHCTVGGAAVVLGHLHLADHVHVSAASVVTRSLLQPGKYTGFFPIDAHAEWEKNAVTVKQLHALRQRIKQVEKSLLNFPGSAEKA